MTCTHPVDCYHASVLVYSRVGYGSGRGSDRNLEHAGMGKFLGHGADRVEKRCTRRPVT